MRGAFVMSWRTVVIRSHTKLSYKNEYLIARGDDVKMIFINEISTLIIDSTQVTMTSYLLSELLKRKVKVIFCDEKRNPQSELVPYYGIYNSSKKIRLQMGWNNDFAKVVWTEIAKQKILNQAKLLEKKALENSNSLKMYAEEIRLFDVTNREGHAAKVYFNTLFGKDFSRDTVCEINAALDYGYAILLSAFNKEIASMGYLTQLGIKHTNEYNHFNLSCDMMEPFRVIVDECVYDNLEREFDSEYKLELIDLINMKVKYCDKEYYLSNAIYLYLSHVIAAIESEEFSDAILYRFE